MATTIYEETGETAGDTFDLMDAESASEATAWQCARLVAYAVLCVEEKLVRLEQMLGARLDELTEAVRDQGFPRAA